MIETTEIRDLIGTRVSGSDGDKLGSIGQIFLDDGTGRPEWATVRTGLCGTKESFVPLAEATRDGEEVRVPFTKDQVKEAPTVPPDAAPLTRAEGGELYRHYGLQYADRASDNGRAGG